MNGIFSYLKSYVILFLVLTILLEMVPKAGMQKYIRFFSQMILAFGLLYPVLGWMGESDAFLEKIEYQSFLQKMEALFGRPNIVKSYWECVLDPKRVKKGGKHIVEFTVTDYCGNETVSRESFIW